MPVPVGTQLGRYTVLKPLVSGGDSMTEVLLARALGMGGFAHHVVIKAIRSTKATDPSFIKAFVDEARLSASLHHSHIVQVHDVGREGDDYFFAMEYVHGENLRALLAKAARNGALVPLDQVMTIVLAVAAGLHYAHQQNIVHRDVTPANILIGYDGNVKVTDFGIAKALLRSSDATKSGTMRGKVAYMAPEQCLGRAVDRRADIFSLGIVLYELVTSRRLFKGDTDFMIMTSIVNGKIPKPTLHRADLPLDLEDVILKALAPKPELRFATAEDFALALEKVAVANHIRVSPMALGEYLAKQFGTRAEPWLVDDKLEAVDVDFDGGGSGLVEVDRARTNPATERELMQSPLLSPFDDEGSLPAGFEDDGATQIQSPDDIDEAAATSGFEANERTLLGDVDDVDMLVNMSRIATPTPSAPPPATRDTAATEPVPTVPLHVERSQPLPPMTPAPPQSLAHTPSGTPMLWAADGDVPSLRPNHRRFVLGAVVALSFAVLVIVLVARSDRPIPHAASPAPSADGAPRAPSAAPADAAPPDAVTPR